MTQAPATSNVLRMAAPLVISFWMRAVITFVDTIYASFLGDAAVAAIGLSIPVEFMMIAVWVGLSTGLTAALSRAMGERAGAKIDQYLRAAWRLVWIVSPVFAVIGVGAWVLAPHLGLETEVAGQFRIYGTVLFAGSSLTTFWSVIPDSLVKAHHDTRSTMWAGIWSNVINFALNTLFLFVFGWGVFGIALSTVIGRLGGLVYAIVQARRHESARRIAWGEAVSEPAQDPEPYRRMLALAIPASATFTLMALEGVVVNGLLANMRHSTEAIAAAAIYNRVMLFAFQPTIATSVAMLPFAARCFGAGDIAAVRRGFRQALLANAVYAVALVGPLMLVVSPWIAAWLAESELTRDYTTFALYTVPAACLLGIPFLMCRSVFEALNRGRPGLVMAAFRYLILTAPSAWVGIVAAQAMGYPGLYGMIVGLTFAGGVASVVFALWLHATLREVAG